MSDHYAIEVKGLRKTYGQFEAVRGIEFTVPRGEVFGLLGPNGAGKTTTVEILEGYRTRSAGEVAVLGFDPGERSRALRARLGIVLQSTGLYRHIKVREAVAHFAGMYPHPRDVDEVVTLVGLQGKEDAMVRTLSGGSCAASTLRSRSSATPTSSSSTSRRPALTRRRAVPRGTRSDRCETSGRPCC